MAGISVGGKEDLAGPAGPASSVGRRRHPAGAFSDAEVLAAVIELSDHYRAPSTSLITWRLAHGHTVTGAFQSAVRDALQHLRAAGQVACTTHRGTHHWSPTHEHEQPPA